MCLGKLNFATSPVPVNTVPTNRSQSLAAIPNTPTSHLKSSPDVIPTILNSNSPEVPTTPTFYSQSFNHIIPTTPTSHQSLSTVQSTPLSPHVIHVTPSNHLHSPPTHLVECDSHLESPVVHVSTENLSTNRSQSSAAIPNTPTSHLKSSPDVIPTILNSNSPEVPTTPTFHSQSFNHVIPTTPTSHQSLSTVQSTPLSPHVIHVTPSNHLHSPTTHLVECNSHLDSPVVNVSTENSSTTPLPSAVMVASSISTTCISSMLLTDKSPSFLYNSAQTPLMMSSSLTTTNSNSTSFSSPHLVPTQIPWSQLPYGPLTLSPPAPSITLLHGWIHLPDFLKLTLLKLVECDNGSVQVAISFVVRSDLTWSVFILDQAIDITYHSLFHEFPSVLVHQNQVHELYHLLAHSFICSGNPDERFRCLLDSKRCLLRDQDQHMIAYVDSHAVRLANNGMVSCTIRHVDCHLIISKGYRCVVCIKYRSKLRSQLSRHWNENVTIPRTALSSHVNFRYLKTPKKRKRMMNLRTDAYAKKIELLRIRKKLQSCGIRVDENLHQDLISIMTSHHQKILEEFPPGSFQRLFWEEQFKSAKLSDAHGLRWHPMMIRWCLYLRHISSGAYEAIRNSGVLTLPSQRTLRDYTHHMPSKVGFNASVDEQLMVEAGMDHLKEYEKCVVILADEMHIKDDLVYNKHTGELVGFVNLSNVNNVLSNFGDSSEPTLATYVFVIMVRGLFIHLEYPYACFPSTGITGDAMYPIIWEAVRRLETCEFKVLGVTADGASPNRKFFRLHKSPDAKKDSVTYKTKNPYSDDECDIFFISDPPHLIKTIRNSLFNSKRALWVS